MSATSYDPTTTIPVTFTDKAVNHLAKQVAQHKAAGIEFKVKESGCSGFKYLLELADEIDDGVAVYQLSDALQLFISPEVRPLIFGTQVDYVQEGVNFQLKFDNPNATALCGCGESFSVEQQA